MFMGSNKDQYKRNTSKEKKKHNKSFPYKKLNRRKKDWVSEKHNLYEIQNCFQCIKNSLECPCPYFTFSGGLYSLYRKSIYEKIWWGLHG